MTIEEMYKELTGKNDDLEINPQSIRASMLGKKKVFITFSRTSTYGLKKWEKDNENLRGGTIKKMVIEYLEKNSHPIHVTELANYIRKYRDKVTPNNIYANMKLDKYGYFIDYKCGFLGLKKKVYQEFKPIKINGFLFSDNRLKKYNGYKLNDFIGIYCKKYGYLKVQVESVLQEMQINKKIIITPDYKMVIL